MVCASSARRSSDTRCCEQYTARDSVVLAPIERPEDSIDALIDRALAEDKLRDSIQRGEARLKAC